MDTSVTHLLIRGLKRAAQQHHLRLVFYGCLDGHIFGRLGKEVPLSAIGYDSGRLAGTVSFFGGDGLVGQLVNQHKAGHPTALVLRAGGAVPHILVDDDPVFEALICRLHRQGHRRIAHLRGTTGNLSADRRFGAYCRGLAAAGLPFDPELVFETDFVGERSFEVVTRALGRSLGITAFVAASDPVALGAMRAAKALGVSIPEQLEVVGYDNCFEAALSEPALSTFQIPFEEMACAAVAETAAQINGRAPQFETLIPPFFVGRSSTRFTDTDPVLDSRHPASPSEGPLCAHLIALIDALPSDSPIETLLTAANSVMKEGIRLGADLPLVAHAIVDRTCGSASSEMMAAERRRGILTAAMEIALSATWLAQVQASEYSDRFSKTTRALREGALTQEIIAEVVREALAVSGFREATLHLNPLHSSHNLSFGAPALSKFYHWNFLSHHHETTDGDDQSVVQSALMLAERHSMALILPLIIGTEVLGHIVADGSSRFQSEVIRLVREVTSALHRLALDEQLRRSNATLRESEYFYASLVESLPQIIARKDSAGRITYANSAFARIVGRPIDLVIGSTDAEITPSELAQRERNDDLRVLATGETFEDEHTYIIDGHPKVFRVHKSPLRGGDGTITGVQVIFWDVTSFRETEKRLRETQRELIEVSRLAGIAEIATGILHNIGNALNSVNTSAGVIADKINRMRVGAVGRIKELLVGETETWSVQFKESDRGRKVVDYVHSLDAHFQQARTDVLSEVQSLRDGVDHVNQIVAAQQQFAQVSGIVDEFDPSEAADYTLRLCEAEFLRHGIVVTRDYQPAPRVRLERHKTVQILVNLIRNAKESLASVDRASKKIVISTRTTASGGAQIAVCDNGAGINAESLPLIFSMGFTTKKDGHGFGLHNSALTAQSLGGSLHVESDGPGLGARFSLDLPAVRAPK